MATKKPKPEIRPICFKEANFKALEYLDEQGNKSEYICRLILLDMELDVLRNKDKIAALLKGSTNYSQTTTCTLDTFEGF